MIDFPKTKELPKPRAVTEFGPSNPADPESTEMKENLRVLMITSEYPTAERPMKVPFIKRQVEFLRKAGIRVDVFHFKGRKRLLNYIKAWFRLRKHMKGKEYDLIHAQWGHSAALAIPKRLPWVITFRGNDLEGIIGRKGKPTYLGKVLQLVSKTTSNMADGVIVVSESLARQLSRNDYSVIPSGLDLEIFKDIPKSEARKTLGLPLDKKLILFAANTVENPRKRFELARAAVEIVKKRFDTELVVATRVAHEQIPYFMNACDALLLTSVHEGSPNVVKEALACNLPVVSVDVGDVRDRVESVEGCFISSDDTKEKIAEVLERVLERDAVIDGRSAIAELDERKTTSKVIKIYQTAVKESKAKEEVSESEMNLDSTSSEV